MLATVAELQQAWLVCYAAEQLIVVAYVVKSADDCDTTSRSPVASALMTRSSRCCNRFVLIAVATGCDDHCRVEQADPA